MSTFDLSGVTINANNLSIGNKTNIEDIGIFVKKYIEGIEGFKRGTFVKNENGYYIYSAGSHYINLEHILRDIIEYYNENNIKLK